MNLETWLSHSLNQRKDKGLLRELKTTIGLKDFCSNDYLGLAGSEALFKHSAERLEGLNLKQNGATGSRLISGNSLLLEETESKLASIFKSTSALIFNSGYTANLAVISSIPQKGDTIIYDELAHACIRDGARLSLAKRFSFRHNDLNDLEQKLKRSEGKIFIAVESIYSMDGDECPLRDLTQLADTYDASIILDEAHSTGIMGKDGGGYAMSLGLEDKIAIRIYTFGKAMGCHGACVTGSKDLIQYLVNYARPFIYTTALSPHSIVAISCTFDFLAKHIHLQNELKQKISLFHSESKKVGEASTKSAIQTRIFTGNENARRAAIKIQKKGFDVRPILSPTVQEGTERLRICLHTYNADQDIQALVNMLADLKAVKI